MPRDGEYSLDFKKRFCECPLRCKPADGKWVAERTFRDHKQLQRVVEQIAQLGCQADTCTTSDQDEPESHVPESEDDCRLEAEANKIDKIADLSLENNQDGDAGSASPILDARDDELPDEGDGDQGFADILPEEVELIKLVLHLYNLASDTSLSNATISKLLSWAFAEDGSLAALLHPKWKEVFEKYAIPTNYDQVKFIANSQHGSCKYCFLLLLDTAYVLNQLELLEQSCILCRQCQIVQV